MCPRPEPLSFSRCMLHALCLLLLLGQTLVLTAPPLRAEPATHGGAECGDTRQPDPAEGHADHQPGTPCAACDELPCPAQRDCGRVGVALLAGPISLNVDLTDHGPVSRGPQVPTSAHARKLFHPPKICPLPNP